MIGPSVHVVMDDSVSKASKVSTLSSPMSTGYQEAHKYMMLCVASCLSVMYHRIVPNCHTHYILL